MLATRLHTLATKSDMLALKSHMLATSSAKLHLIAHTHLVLNLSVSVRQAQVLFLTELPPPSLAGTQQLSWLPAMKVQRWEPLCWTTALWLFLALTKLLVCLEMCLQNVLAKSHSCQAWTI